MRKDHHWSFWVLGWLVCIQPVHAHAPGLSSADIRIGTESIELRLTLAPQDMELLLPLDTDRDADVSAQEWQAARQPFAALLSASIHMELDAQPVAASDRTEVSYDSNNNVHALLHYPASSHRRLHFAAGFLDRLPGDHRLAITVSRTAQTLLENHVLTRRDASFNIATADNAATTSDTFSSFLQLGIEHIVTGYDHLLFLLGLLLVSQRLLDYLTVVTCFTLAHSLTLILATLGYVVAIPNLIEPLIAATIVYVGVENLLRADALSKRYLLVLTFGLIHGFGFAGALSEAGIGTAGVDLSLPLLAFNLGVELGQISLVAIALPALQTVHRYDRQHGTRWSAYGSVLVALAGCYWLWERTLGFAAMTERVANW